MQTITEDRLETEVQYRFEYLTEFIGFTSEDAAAIQSFAPHLGPRIPELVERTYTKLLSCDATARHFVPNQHGCEGESPANVTDLDMNHPHIKFRRDHLNRYLMQLIGRSYDSKMVQYLDMVGKMHTPLAGNREIDVPLVQMNALMGLLSDLLMDVISQSSLNPESAANTQRAFNKLLWIQNDFISRHYCR